LTYLANRPGDLLVVGAGRRPYWMRARVTRYCLRHAACSVLTVEPPAMTRDLHRRHWVDEQVRMVLGP
jgi:hypothetical protein